MFRAYIREFLTTPRRLWAWAQIHPYESIGYGSILLFLSLAAQPIITAAAAVAIIGGIYQIFRHP